MDIGLMLLVLTVINCFIYFLFYRGTPMRLFGYRCKGRGSSTKTSIHFFPLLLISFPQLL